VHGSVNVTGTPWSGVLHAEHASQIVAHAVWESHLMIQAQAGAYVALEDDDDTAPALYRAVTGSFDATLLLGGELPAAQWECPGLLAYDPDTLAPNYVFVSSFAVNNRMLTRSTSNGVSTTLVAPGVQHWLRLLRDEEMIWTFSRATNADAWRVLAALTRPDLPEVLWVGPVNAPFNDAGVEYFYDRCTIEQRETIPEPHGMIVLTALLLLAAGHARRWCAWRLLTMLR